MTTDAEKLFDEIDSLQVRLRTEREVSRDLVEKLAGQARVIEKLRRTLEEKTAAFKALQDSADVHTDEPEPDAMDQRREFADSVGMPLHE